MKATAWKKNDDGNALVAVMKWSENNNSQGFGHLTFRLMHYNREQEKLYNIIDGPLNDLEIRCQYDTREPIDILGRDPEKWEKCYRPYAWRITHHTLYYVEPHNITALYEFHKKIARKIKRYADDLGEPQNFADYVIRYCRALDVQAIIVSDTAGIMRADLSEVWEIVYVTALVQTHFTSRIREQADKEGLLDEEMQPLLLPLAQSR